MCLSAIRWTGLSADEQRTLLQRPAAENDIDFNDAVAEIIRQVRTTADAAVRDLTARIDKVDLADFRVGDDEI